MKCLLILKENFHSLSFSLLRQRLPDQEILDGGCFAIVNSLYYLNLHVSVGLNFLNHLDIALCVCVCVCVCVCLVTSVMLDSLRPHGLQPTRFLCSWDSPGKNSGVGCHALLQKSFLTQGSNWHLLHLPALAGWFFTTSSTWEAPGIALLLLETIQTEFLKLLLWETQLQCCFHTIKATNKA